MAVAYPEVNGSRHSWANIEVKLDNDVYRGVVAINYKSPLTPELVYGTGPQPIGRTDGEEAPDADMEMLLDEAQTFVKHLATVGGNSRGWKQVTFDIFVAFSPFGLDVVRDELISCRCIDAEASQQRGTGAITRKFPLSVLRVRNFGLDGVKVGA